MEAALWSALRSLEEKAALTKRLVERAERQSHRAAADRFKKKLIEVEAHASTIRDVLAEGIRRRVLRSNSQRRSTNDPSSNGTVWIVGVGLFGGLIAR